MMSRKKTVCGSCRRATGFTIRPRTRPRCLLCALDESQSATERQRLVEAAASALDGRLPEGEHPGDPKEKYGSMGSHRTARVGQMIAFYVQEYRAAHGREPTDEEVRRACGMSTTDAVRWHRRDESTTPR